MRTALSPWQLSISSSASCEWKYGVLNGSCRGFERCIEGSLRNVLMILSVCRFEELIPPESRFAAVPVCYKKRFFLYLKAVLGDSQTHLHNSVHHKGNRSNHFWFRTFAVLIRNKLFSLTLILGVICSTDLAPGDPIDWPVLSFTRAVSNAFNAPTCITHAGDGSQRLFVVEQDGRIWIIQSNSVPMLPFLDVTNRVLRGTE